MKIGLGRDAQLSTIELLRFAFWSLGALSAVVLFLNDLDDWRHAADVGVLVCYLMQVPLYGWERSLTKVKAPGTW